VVLIGASRFDHPELPDLPAVRHNLDGLAACFRDPGLWGARCTVVADPDSTVALVDPVHEAAAEAEDTLLVYYAGHGLVHPRTLGLLLAVTGSAPGRTHSAVPYDLVRDNVIEARAARKVVILDCCYSGRALGGMADPTTAVADEASVAGTYLLASAPPNKQALSPPGETYTAFTGALLALLDQGMPNGPPLLRLDTIYRHVRDTLRRGSRPEPQIRADNTAGDLALVRNRWHAAPSTRTSSAQPTSVPSRSATIGYLRSLVEQPGIVAPFERKEPRREVLDDRYQLGDIIGTSRTAFSHVATDLVRNRTVVVTMLSQPAPSPARRRDFLQTMSRTIPHPLIAGVVDAGESTTRSGQSPYIVTEYVEGSTLSAVLRSHGPLEPFAAADVVSEVCAALDHGHRQGRGHGDLSPDNVMLTRTGGVRVLNYGIAQYLSDNQAIDESDIQADVHAAGALLFELLTGTPPTLMFRLVVQQGSGLPPELNGIVEKALRPRQADRYQTAALLRDDLQRVLAQRSL
jgi:hypothetical protein